MRLSLTLALILVSLGPAAAAQDQARRPDPLQPEGENLATPPTWSVRFDHLDPAATVGADSTDSVFFVNMTPGWHVTTGPAAILYHPASTAAGAYRAEALVHLFSPGERNEAFGLFVGGRDLAGHGVAYDYFVIRRSGEFLIKRRTGTETSVLVPWTPHAAVVQFTPETECCVANTLAVDAGADEVAFLVNGQEVARLPRRGVHADGVVGLRVNHGLNLHVESFAVTPR